MLEILALIGLNKKIGTMLRAKGRKPLGYQLLSVALWFGSEIIGAVAGVFILAALGSEQPDQCIVYVFGVFGAVTGAVLAYVIADSAKPVEPATTL